MAVSTEGQPGVMLGGRYRISGSLGSIGAVQLMAGVELASGRPVMLERLPLTAAAPDAASRLEQRARQIAQVRHPGLLEVRESLQADAALWAVLEPPSAESLRARLTREPATVVQLLAWLAGAMRAVSALHEHGVLHRGLCPELIFVASDPAARTRVAPLVLGELAASAGPGDPRLAYCSVEELAGEPDLDARCDVYAFGAIAYEALAGRQPFARDGEGASLLRVMTEAPTPLARLRPDLPIELCTLIDLALAKRRQERLGRLERVLALLEPCTQALRSRAAPLYTLASAHPQPLAAELASVPRLPDALGASSLQPVDKPATHTARPHWVSLPHERVNPRAAWAAAGALVVIGLWGWSLRAPGEPPAATPAAASVPAQDTRPAAVSGNVLNAPAAEGSASARVDAGSPAAPDAAIPDPRGSTAVDAPAVRARPARKLAPAIPADPPAPDCDPNYLFDARGEKHWKPECF